ncbi:MAG: AMP-binding protein, partial [Gammaproteobacteria bacterium]
MSQHATGPKFPFTTLVELLRWRALHQPDRHAYTFVLDGESKEARLTYAELDRQARAIAARLQARGTQRERVLLLYPSGLEYIAAFFGCLYAGAMAVSAYPPRHNRSLSRLQAMAADAQATLALTTTNILSRLDKIEVLPEAVNLNTLQWLATDSMSNSMDNLADGWKEPSINSDTLAFLQYTSGSTARPKGVMISHGNLLYNNRMVQQAFEQTENSTFVGWLPLFHDMGLIGNVLQPLFLGSACILMSPEAFLMKPWRWLQAVSRYRAHTSGGPNFSYDLCVRKITPEQRTTLDLSCWQVAFNGAEPVRHATLERFARTFEPCGFRREAFYP